jgi:hypothetical protein
MILLYANHRLRNIMSGSNLAETKQKEFIYLSLVRVEHNHPSFLFNNCLKEKFMAYSILEERQND